MHAHVRAVLLAAALWSSASAALAQDVAHSFSELRLRVHLEEVVTVTGHDGRRAKGAITSLTDTTLVVRGDAAGRPWEERDVARVSKRQRDSLWNGALMGAFSGAALIGTAVLVNGGLEGDSLENVLGLAAISTGIGALGGVAIDAMVTTERELFRAQPPPLGAEAAAGRVRVGEAVVVTGADGREVRGRLTELTPTSLAVDVDGRIVEWRQGGWTLRQRQRDSLVNGTLIGAAVGLGVGFGLGAGAAAAEVYSMQGTDDSDATLLVSFGTVVGAAVGMAIDAAKQDELVVVGPPLSQSHLRLRVLPLVTRHAQGLGVSLSF
ncbi:hypothetical protein [Luteitalea sp.]|jgi:hypothetical protein|uniref:hypothetical protein n=1 Tax=Luteitalea sp. TaxID=2004800 RepID=UPI0037C8F944